MIPGLFSTNHVYDKAPDGSIYNGWQRGYNISCNMANSAYGDVEEGDLFMYIQITTNDGGSINARPTGWSELGVYETGDHKAWAGRNFYNVGDDVTPDRLLNDRSCMVRVPGPFSGVATVGSLWRHSNGDNVVTESFNSTQLNLMNSTYIDRYRYACAIYVTRGDLITAYFDGGEGFNSYDSAIISTNVGNEYNPPDLTPIYYGAAARMWRPGETCSSLQIRLGTDNNNCCMALYAWAQPNIW